MSNDYDKTSNLICGDNETTVDNLFPISELINQDKAIAFIESTSLEQVEALEDKIIEIGANEIDKLNEVGLCDKLCNGMYSRVLNIPKGVYLTGKIHKRDYIDIFISGDVTVKSYFDNGDIEKIERVNSFRYFEGKPGRKRVLFTHEDTVWVTVDPTTKNNIHDVEADVVTNQMKDYKLSLEEA